MFKPAGAIGVFNTSTKMEAYHEDKFADSTDRLLKLRRNPNKMDVLRRLQCHFVDKISHLLESSSTYFQVPEQMKETTTSADGAPEQKTDTIYRLAHSAWRIG